MKNTKTHPGFTVESSSMKHRTWVLVADQAHARIFARENGGSYHLVEEMDHPIGKLKAKDLGSDQPGLGFGKGGIHGHALAAHTDAQEHNADIFANQIGAALDKGRTTEKFNELVLVAGPKLLGKLRSSLTSETAKLVRNSHEKDYAKLSTNEIAEKLEELLALH